MERPILIIEDSEADYEVLTRAFAKNNLSNPLKRCSDGDEALNYLFKNAETLEETNNTKPCVVLLDLNLPGTDGHEVLKMIKQSDYYKDVPVIILTSSKDELDVSKCYKYGANSYMQKPVTFSSFIDAIQKLCDYWLSLNIIPKN